MTTLASGEVRKGNIIDMSLGFTAMMRIFEAGAKAKITSRFADFSEQLVNVKSENEYEKLHSRFCEWFSKSIRTARNEVLAPHMDTARRFSISQLKCMYITAVSPMLRSQNGWCHCCVAPSTRKYCGT